MVRRAHGSAGGSLLRSVGLAGCVQGREAGVCRRHGCAGTVAATSVSGISVWIWGENCALVTAAPMGSAENNPCGAVSPAVCERKQIASGKTFRGSYTSLYAFKYTFVLSMKCCLSRKDLHREVLCIAHAYCVLH